jgi:hypothetical protein
MLAYGASPVEVQGTSENVIYMELEFLSRIVNDVTLEVDSGLLKVATNGTFVRM